MGIDITADEDETTALAIGDVDGDGDLDLVAGNNLSLNRLYLNNGTLDPFNGVMGIAIGSAIPAGSKATHGVALGDVDNDGHLDLVVGNIVGGGLDARNQLYLNDGTGDPWDGQTGMMITSDADDTKSIALGDIDGDGFLDVVVAK